MQRVTATPTATLSNGKPGYQDRNLAEGIVGTPLQGAPFSALQEEVCSVIEIGAGQTIDPTNYTNLLTALNHIIATAIAGLDPTTNVNAAIVAAVAGLDPTATVNIDIAAAVAGLATAVSVAAEATARSTAVGNETTRAEAAESALSTAIGNEATRAEGVESAINSKLNEFTANLSSTGGFSLYTTAGQVIFKIVDGVSDAAGSGQPTQTITFASAFPTQIQGVIVSTGIASASTATDVWYQEIRGSRSNGSIVVQRQIGGGGSDSGPSTIPTIIAWGT